MKLSAIVSSQTGDEWYKVQVVFCETCFPKTLKGRDLLVLCRMKTQGEYSTCPDILFVWARWPPDQWPACLGHARLVFGLDISLDMELYLHSHSVRECCCFWTAVDLS